MEMSFERMVQIIIKWSGLDIETAENVAQAILNDGDECYDDCDE